MIRIENVVQNALSKDRTYDIASVFVSLEANVLPTWELVCLFLLKMC